MRTSPGNTAGFARICVRSASRSDPNDLWIAAHALALDVPLVTHNLSEFRRVPGLSVETWLTGTA